MKLNKKVTLPLLFILLFVCIVEARILLMVNADYYAHSWRKVQRYIQELGIDDIPTSMSLYHPDPAKDQFYVWKLVRDYYTTFLAKSDTLKGIVMIGDIPPTVFYHYDATIVCDYLYMDVWNEKVTPPKPYATWDEPWDKWSPGIIKRASYDGDEKLDLWVSRIYASNLNYLRDPGKPWGEFLEEYEIIDRYLDRLHTRMTKPAKVPRRAFAMGPPPGFAFGSLKDHCALHKLGLNSDVYFDNSNMRLDQAAAWQAQLQRGRKGTFNFGSLYGKRFSDFYYMRNCQTNYPDSRGYEWAAVYAHSTATEHAFHMFQSTGNYMLGGAFSSVNHTQPWTRINSGGYSGMYYEWNLQHDQGALAEWSCVIPKGKSGTYEVYMYWNSAPALNSDNSEFILFGNKYFNFVGCGRVHQNTASTGWHRLESTWKAQWKQFKAEEGDTLVLRFHPNRQGFNRHNRCVADAIKFKKVSGSPYEVIITPYNTFDISKRGQKGFRLMNWYNRSFCDMQDDGGQSKVPFFEIMGCWAANYFIDDSIGLLYAMGHQGLTSIGNSTPLYARHYYTRYTTALESGASFGEAYRHQAQEWFTLAGANENFILFGAGTLSAKPNISYSPDKE